MNRHLKTTVRASMLALVSCAIAFGPARPGRATVPQALVDELGGVLDEALSSDNGEARAWALRARALRGDREARELLLGYRDNADLIVRVFVGVGLIDLGRREGRAVLTAEIASAGSASRQRILERYVRHLPQDDQVEILQDVLQATTEPEALRQVLAYIGRYGQGEVFGLLGRAAEVSEGERALYVEALVESNRAEAVDVASTLAGSGESAVRLAAVEVATAIGGDDARALLESLIGDPDAAVSAAAAFSLAPIGVPAAYTRLLDLARSGEPAERSAALEAIRDGQPSLLAFDDLYGMLEGASDPVLRRRILEALGATGSDEAFRLLAELVESDVYDERLPAISALGYTHREAAVPLLSAVLLGGGGSELRTLAAEALGHLELASAAEPLLDALDRERGGEVKVAVIRALATTGSDEAVWPLAFQLTNPDEEVVRAALFALSKLGARAVAPQVETVFTSHRNPDVRWAAALVLFSLDPEVGQIRLMQALDRPPDGFMTDIDALPEGPRLEAYRRLVRHNNPDIRLLAFGRILRLPGGGLDILRELVDPATPSDIRQLAVAHLTANRDPQDLPLFTELADSSNRTMRTQALEAIVELALPESEALLRAQLDSTDLERRTMAVYGLWKMADS